MSLDLGEIREVGIQVYSKIGQPFVIDTAEYEILTANEELLENGLATIEDDKVLMLFHATQKGAFIVKFKYMIDDETLIAKIKIGVI